MQDEAMKLEYEALKKQTVSALERTATALSHENATIAEMMDLSEVATMLGHAIQRLASLKEYLDKEN